MQEDRKQQALRWKAEYRRRRLNLGPQLPDAEFESLRVAYNEYQAWRAREQRAALRVYKERFGSL